MLEVDFIPRGAAPRSGILGPSLASEEDPHEALLPDPRSRCSARLEAGVSPHSGAVQREECTKHGGGLPSLSQQTPPRVLPSNIVVNLDDRLAVNIARYLLSHMRSNTAQSTASWFKVG